MYMSRHPGNQVRVKPIKAWRIEWTCAMWHRDSLEHYLVHLGVCCCLSTKLERAPNEYTLSHTSWTKFTPRKKSITMPTAFPQGNPKITLSFLFIEESHSVFVFTDAADAKTVAGHFRWCCLGIGSKTRLFIKSKFTYHISPSLTIPMNTLTPEA